MSGIEVAGLVLGGFPILLNCLDYYRKGFEPLEEWWNFRTRFIEFIDNIRHQAMRYNENMYRLLDPIIPDVESLNRMIDLPSSDPSFRKNKHNKIERLAKYNQQLQEILGYSERVLQISDRKKSSELVTNLEKIRQHACHLHSALRRIWKCPESRHHHDAHLSLRADITSVKLQVYFAISHDPNEATSTMQEVLVHPVETDLPPLSSNIGYPQQSRMLATIQQTAIQQEETLEEKSGFLDSISLFKPKRPSSTVAPWKAEPQIPVRKAAKKSVKLQSPVPEINVNPPHALSNVASNRSATPSIDPEQILILNLSEFLTNKAQDLGMIRDDSTERFLKISKSSRQIQTLKLALLPLPELLNTYRQQKIQLSRQIRFEMATHIASALLQTHNSPWIAEKWTKYNFFFLTDTASRTLCSTHPFISKNFCASVENGAASCYNPESNPAGRPSEEEVRASLFTIGVMILELIFGYNIEDCAFRRDYFGRDDRPTDQTDISTAKKWARGVLEETGATIDDAVRRCLDCSFGPKPNFGDIRFRESVYQGVIRPLAEYKKIWPEVQL
ncbi:hypothetical protein DL765_009835 [Monosporascus sp. GIB2]|nr:hypothetical protein DL765_009835 [Monosporascus sp. GIB2]